MRSEFIFVQCVLRVYSFSTKNSKFIREFLFNINIKKERERWPYLRKTLGVTRIGRAVKNKRKYNFHKQYTYLFKFLKWLSYSAQLIYLVSCVGRLFTLLVILTMAIMFLNYIVFINLLSFNCNK